MSHFGGEGVWTGSTEKTIVSKSFLSICQTFFRWLPLRLFFQDFQKFCILTFSGKLRPKIKTKQDTEKPLRKDKIRYFFVKNEFCEWCTGAEIDELLKCSLARCSLLSPGGLSVSLCPVASLQSCRDQPPETDLIHIPSSAAEKVNEGGMER